MIFILIIVISSISLSQSNLILQNDENSFFLAELAVIFCKLHGKTIHIYYENEIIMDVDRLIKDLEEQCYHPVAIITIR